MKWFLLVARKGKFLWVGAKDVEWCSAWFRLRGEDVKPRLYASCHPLLTTVSGWFRYPYWFSKIAKTENAFSCTYAFLGKHILADSRIIFSHRDCSEWRSVEVENSRKTSRKSFSTKSSMLLPYDCYYTISNIYSQYKKYNFNRWSYRLFPDK